MFFCSSEVRKELSPCERICGDSTKQKIEKQNELGAKFIDYRGSKLINKTKARSYRAFALFSKNKQLTNTILEGVDKFVYDLRMKHVLTRRNDSLHPIASQLSMLKLSIVLHCFLLKEPIDYQNFDLSSTEAAPENFGGV